MSTTLSFSGTLFRANVFDRYVLRKFGGTSNGAAKEFGGTIDLSNNPTIQFPIAIPIQDIKTIKFLSVNVIGGTATVRLVKNGAYTTAPNVVRVTNEVVSTAPFQNPSFLAHTSIVTNTESVYTNGERKTPGTDYVLSSNVLTFMGTLPTDGDHILVDYYYNTNNNLPTPLTTQTLDINVSGTMLMSEIDINQVYILACPSNAVIEVIGMGD
jgi:hypothetical protein